MDGEVMRDRKYEVSAGGALAAALWLATVVSLGLSWSERDVYLATVACVVGLAAGTLTIRQFFVSQNALMCDAFALGREAGRLESRPEMPSQRGIHPVH